MVPRGSRLRRAWAVGAAVITVARPRLHGRAARRASSASTTSSSFRGEQGRSLHRLLETAAVERGLRCGAVSVPTHKLIPDTRWILDLGGGRRRRALRSVGGVAAQGALRRRDLPGRAHEHPAHRLRRQHGRDHAGARRRASGGSRPTSTSPHTCAARPGVRERLRRRRRPRWTLALGGVLARRARLRLWGIKHGLPFVYNVDEASNFVPTAVSFYFTDSYNPHYFINPPAFSYLLHVVLAIWFGGGWPFGAEDEVGRAYATDPTAVFVVARVTSAVLGTAAVGVRLPDRRAPLRPPRRPVRRAVMAVAFLPVFYSHLALNDVPALLPLTVSVYGSAGVLTRGRAARLRDRRRRARPRGGDEVHGRDRRAAAARGRGLPAAADSASARRGAAGRGSPRALAAAAFFAREPARAAVVRRVLGRRAQAGGGGRRASASSGSTTTRASLLPLGADLGLGWVPLAAALAGRWSRSADDVRRALFLVPWPLVFIVYMGLQDRFFGRWLLPALPALALLAGLAAVRAARPARGRAAARARGAGAGAGRGAARRRASSTASTSTACCRATTRATSRGPGWSANVPPGSKVVVEPIVPDAWFADAGRPRRRGGPRAAGLTRSGRRWIKFPTGRTTIDEQGRTRRGGKGRFVSDRGLRAHHCARP